jgi:hypothetical protein
MNLEKFNSELRKRLDDFETEKRDRGAAIIDQLINDIQDNEWYCIQGGSESELEDWEKNLIVIGQRKLLED